MRDMNKLDYVIGIVGAGSMGGAIASGLVASCVAEPSAIMVANPSEAPRAALEKLGIRAFADAAEMVGANPDVVVLAVKPQVLPSVLAELADSLAGRTVISIAAGVSLATLEGALPASRVVRVMPNLPVKVLSGATAICAGSRATAVDIDRACGIFGALGSARVMREDQLDAEGAVVGCGPAYVALFADVLTRAAVEHGMSCADAREMILSTIRGVATQLLESGEHPRAYMDKVTSPGGTTAAGLRALEPDLFLAVEDAVDAALVRTDELAGR